MRRRNTATWFAMSAMIWVALWLAGVRAMAQAPSPREAAADEVSGRGRMTVSVVRSELTTPHADSGSDVRVTITADAMVNVVVSVSVLAMLFGAGSLVARSSRPSRKRSAPDEGR